MNDNENNENNEIMLRTSYETSKAFFNISCCLTDAINENKRLELSLNKLKDNLEESNKHKEKLIIVCTELLYKNGIKNKTLSDSELCKIKYVLGEVMSYPEFRKFEEYIDSKGE